MYLKMNSLSPHTCEKQANEYSQKISYVLTPLFFNPLIIPDSLNTGSIILDIVDGSPPGLVQTEWYVEWSNGQTGLVNEHLAPGEYTAWLREEVTNALLDSVHVIVGMGSNATSINEYKKCNDLKDSLKRSEEDFKFLYKKFKNVYL